MPRPDDKPVHSLDLNVTVHGDRFGLNGVFALADGLAAMDHWAKKLGGTDDELTPEQLTDLLARAEKIAKRLEGIDSQGN